MLRGIEASAVVVIGRGTRCLAEGLFDEAANCQSWSRRSRSRLRLPSEPRCPAALWTTDRSALVAHRYGANVQLDGR